MTLTSKSLWNLLARFRILFWVLLGYLPMHGSLKNLLCLYLSFSFKRIFVKFQIQILLCDLTKEFSWKLVLVQNLCQIFYIIFKTFNVDFAAPIDVLMRPVFYLEGVKVKINLSFTHLFVLTVTFAISVKTQATSSTESMNTYRKTNIFKDP